MLDTLRQISYTTSRGAEVVAFPETYPGPWHAPMTFDPGGDGCRCERARCHDPVWNAGRSTGRASCGLQRPQVARARRKDQRCLDPEPVRRVRARFGHGGEPEEIVFEADGPGTFLIDVDLTRIRETREQEDGPKSSEEYGAKPGVLTQWQRPEMQDKVYPSVTRI